MQKQNTPKWSTHTGALAATRITATQTEFKDVRKRALTLVRELIIQTY